MSWMPELQGSMKPFRRLSVYIHFGYLDTLAYRRGQAGDRNRSSPGLCVWTLDRRDFSTIEPRVRWGQPSDALTFHSLPPSPTVAHPSFTTLTSMASAIFPSRLLLRSKTAFQAHLSFIRFTSSVVSSPDRSRPSYGFNRLGPNGGALLSEDEVKRMFDYPEFKSPQRESSAYKKWRLVCLQICLNQFYFFFVNWHHFFFFFFFFLL